MRGSSGPASLDELAEIVAAAPRVRAIGSRHSFTDIVDSDVLVSLEAVPPVFDLDAEARTVTIGGGARYGEVSRALHDRGWALANLASLPHISVAGAVATSTHGSGDTNASLATAVAGLTLMDGSGASRTVRRGDPDHAGTVVGLGALGIVTTLTLEVEPAYDVRQDVWTDLPYAEVADHFDEITASGYSVSLFTDFSDAGFAQAWVKSRAAEAPTEFFGARPATKAAASRHRGGGRGRDPAGRHRRSVAGAAAALPARVHAQPRRRAPGRVPRAAVRGPWTRWTPSARCGRGSRVCSGCPSCARSRPTTSG